MVVGLPVGSEVVGIAVGLAVGSVVGLAVVGAVVGEDVVGVMVGECVWLLSAQQRMLYDSSVSSVQICDMAVTNLDRLGI